MRLYNNRKSPFSWIWAMITLVIITSFLSELSLVEIAENDLPLLIIGGTDYAIYRFKSRQKRLAKTTLAKPLEDLKANIQLADRKVKLLDSYLADNDVAQ
ncbi:UNVERIFIED_CONTAM: hypothetical protein KB579_04130 [Streptococcus canis]|uniref:hypothetical protein n=1 Tax=Streptococcus canis TaxID=1329 RepID=UPI0024DE869B|nr:hypothetical protein [Streptococcus canis]